MAEVEQNLGNHTKFVPAFHFFVLPVLFANVIANLYQWYRADFPLNRIIPVLVAAALLTLAVRARMFATTLQDRIIRLEERLRYERLLPSDLQARMEEFTVPQVVALRFASDAELPTLARKVLDEKLTEPKTIKRLITNWKPDHLRA
jgi:hypothetical protein